MTISAAEVMKQLEAVGTAQNRKIYARHGAQEPQFGVSFAHLATMRKKLGQNQALALELWATGNTDARMLATMIADPGQMGARLLDTWMKDVNYSGLADQFARNVVAPSPLARPKMKKWMGSRKEWTARAGWTVLACLAMQDATLPDAYLAAALPVIEAKVHLAQNGVRDAMNNALIAIGMRNDALERKAIAAARRIGKIEVNHGETGCKTPDAEAYILKARAHRAQKQTRLARGC